MKILLAKFILFVLMASNIPGLAYNLSVWRGLFTGFTFGLTWWVLFNAPDPSFLLRCVAVLSILLLTIINISLGRSSTAATYNHKNKKTPPSSPTPGAKKPSNGGPVNKERPTASGGKDSGKKKFHSSSRASMKIPAAGPAIPESTAPRRAKIVRGALFSIIFLAIIIFVGAAAAGVFSEAPAGALIVDGRLVAPDLLPDAVRVEFKLSVRGNCYVDPQIYTWTNAEAQQILYEFARHWNYSSGVVEFNDPKYFFSVVYRGAIVSVKTTDEIVALGRSCGGLRVFVEWAAGDKSRLISITLEGLNEISSSFRRS